MKSTKSRRRCSAPTIVRRQRAIARVFVLALTVLATATAFLADAAAQQRQGLPLVRDAEIEGLLRDYTVPIFRAGDLRADGIDIFLVNRNEFNAFVTGRRMFINLGLLAEAESPNEVIGVIAHETGHVIGGHMHRLRDRIEKNQAIAVLGMLAGVGAMVSGGEGGSAAGSAIIMGTQNTLQRSMLAYRRDEERAADRTAFTLLEKTGQSTKGLITTFTRMSRTLALNVDVNPYLVSHPLPRERVGFLNQLASSSPYFDRKDPPSLQFRHDMVRAKIAAYTREPGAVRRMFRRNLNSVPARYGDAIATYLAGSPAAALPKMQALLSEYPDNTYLHEMMGEILLKAGRPKEAVAPFRRAVALDKYKAGIIRIQLGHALMETGDPRALDEAVRELKAGIARDPETTWGYQHLARAYSMTGRNDLALAAAAEHHFVIGRPREAKQFARRAQVNLKHGSPQWLRMQDIIQYKLPKPQRRGILDR